MTTPTNKPKPGPKPVHLLDFPYAAPEWPKISIQDQETILDLLCSLLAPIGTHRRLTSSRKKQKRAPTTTTAEPTTPPPISSHTLLGLNATTRHLEHLVSSTLTPSTTPLLTLLTTHTPPHPLTSHLPPLLAACPRPTPTLLYLSHPSAETRLSAALGLPRTGVLALTVDAPVEGRLRELLLGVAPVCVPWLEGKGVWQPLRVKTVMGEGKRKGEERKGEERKGKRKAGGE